MTDQEKIARMVAWMGGWPEHKWIMEVCARCGQDFYGPYSGSPCKGFNPFERIEDAFLLVEKIGRQKVQIFKDEPGLWHVSIGPEYSVSTIPARAIAEAAWQVIEQLTKEKKLNDKWAREALME